jgi:hypothetical protein
LALVKTRRALTESARWTLGERKRRLMEVTARLKLLSGLRGPTPEGG